MSVFASQVLASYINPAGSSSVHTFEASSSDNSSQNSSALPAMLHELLSQSCLIPAMSSYLRNDSGGCCFYKRGGMKVATDVHVNVHIYRVWTSTLAAICSYMWP